MKRAAMSIVGYTASLAAHAGVTQTVTGPKGETTVEVALDAPTLTLLDEATIIAKIAVPRRASIEWPDIIDELPAGLRLLRTRDKPPVLGAAGTTHAARHWVLAPLRTGEIEVPTLVFTVTTTDGRPPVTLRTEPFVLTVPSMLQPDESADTADFAPARGVLEPPKNRTTDRSAPWGWFVGGVGMFTAVGAVTALRRRRKTDRRNPIQNAIGALQRQIDAASPNLDAARHTMNAAIGGIIGIDTGVHTPEEIEPLCTNSLCARTLCAEIRKIDAVRFAGENTDSTAQRDVLRGTIERLEEADKAAQETAL